MSSIDINPSLDTDALARLYQQHGRVQVPAFLTGETAVRIEQHLTVQKRWNLVYRVAGQHVNSDAGAVAKWPQSKRRKLDKAIHTEAVTGFQYRFANVPIYDIYHQQSLPGDFFNHVFEFLNNDGFLNRVRAITGDERFAFADAQATCYRAGDFLTSHNDEVAGKNRCIAYVLGLTREWRPDWGGALSFLGPDGNVEEAYVPAFNVLSLFRVPTQHLVGIVAPFAPGARYSITGWLRSGADPGK